MLHVSTPLIQCSTEGTGGFLKADMLRLALGRSRVECYSTHRYPIKWPEYSRNNAGGATPKL